jgi:hypothetical protein
VEVVGVSKSQVRALDGGEVIVIFEVNAHYGPDAETAGGLDMLFPQPPDLQSRGKQERTE